MDTHPMKLVTIVTEALAREPISQLLQEEGARGFTSFAVQGFGSSGSRVADIEEFGNVQFQAIVTTEVAERILMRVEREFFPRFACVAFESEVRVLRADKF